jgi:non-specific serine/threonine protein kinase
LTQETLAARARLSARAVSDLERGVNRVPRPGTLALLARALRLGPADRAALTAAAHPPPAAGGPARPPHNLPPSLTSFVGRAREVRALRTLLRRDGVRLVTLTGSGGSGKTRLALRVAADLLPAFPDGASFVALAAVADPELILPATAQALGVREAPGRPARERVLEVLRGRQALLLLDNFEHLLAGAPAVADLLAACPGLTVLVTSRAALRLSGEREFPVPPLALPDPRRPPTAAALARCGATRLFVERARAVRPGFRVTAADAVAVAAICARLDGLPLALELAAARVKLLPPRALLGRLEAGPAGAALRLLAGGVRDAPARQQTLRATLTWSHDLLTPDERRLFRRLAVFAGGFSLAAAEAVGAGEDAGAAAAEPARDVLAGLAALADQSLLRQEEPPDGEPRFGLLETVREFALEQLEASGEAAAVRRQHAVYYLGLAEAAAGGLVGAQHAGWLERLERDHDNVRAALAWCSATPDPTERGLRLAAALAQFWYERGYLSEGRRWLGTLLAGPGPAGPTPARAAALYGAGLLAIGQDDPDAGWALHEECLAVWRALGDRSGVARALGRLGAIARERGEHATARALTEESLAHQRALGDRHGAAWALLELGNAARARGDLAAAREHLGECAALWHAVGDPDGIARSATALGHVARDRGDLAGARRRYAEALDRWRALGHKAGSAAALSNLGLVAREQGDLVAARGFLEACRALRRELAAPAELAYAGHDLASIAERQGDRARAAALYRESLQQFGGLHDARGVALCLGSLASLAGADRRWERAARLLGASEQLLGAGGAVLPPLHRAAHERTGATVRGRLGEAAAVARAAGRAMSFEQAVAYALEDAPT